MFVIGAMGVNHDKSGLGLGRLLCNHILTEDGYVLCSGVKVSDDTIRLWDYFVGKGHYAKLVNFQDSETPFYDYPDLESVARAVREDGDNPETVLILSSSSSF